MPGSLQRDLKQSKPFDSLEEEVFLNLQKTAETLIGGLAEALKPFDLTATQYNVLRILRGAGNDGIPCREVSERMVNRDPDVTRLLDRLEARGLVARTRLVSDRRVVMARIADAGQRLLVRADPAVSAFLRTAMSRIEPSGMRLLNESLEALRDA